jgi:hypothetical protein
MNDKPRMFHNKKNIEENKETNKNPPITIFGEYGNITSKK